MRRPFSNDRGPSPERLRRLRAGDPVEVACRLRRTSARGWGPWTDATIVLPGTTGHDAGVVRWLADDPIAVGFPVTRGPVDLPFEDVQDIWLRSVRFQTEAFWGRSAEIIVVGSERSTIELSVSPAETEVLADRLTQVLVSGPDGRDR